MHNMWTLHREIIMSFATKDKLVNYQMIGKVPYMGRELRPLPQIYKSALN